MGIQATIVDEEWKTGDIVLVNVVIPMSQTYHLGMVYVCFTHIVDNFIIISTVVLYCTIS